MVFGIKNHGSKLRILVMGYIVRGPMGGMTWHHLQYVLGLHAMGHDVFYLEDSGDTEFACYDPYRNITDKDPRYGLTYAAGVFNRIGLGDRWSYFDRHSNRWKGGAPSSVLRQIREADLLINLSFSNVLRPWTMDVPSRILLDTDPLFTQIRNIEDPRRMELVLQHTAHFTYGENIGHHSCKIPDDGITWEPTRQPIVLDRWPFSKGSRKGHFTTVMKWESYPNRSYMGNTYGMKAHSFMPFLQLPALTTQSMELAVSDPATPRDLLKANGWRIADPLHHASDPWNFQAYLQHSKAEFSIAKHGYVAGNTGWFSDRSAAYLATGRPVLLQETGYASIMETGEGLIPFSTPEEAIEGIEEINNNYDRHCMAARDLAGSAFSSEKILNQMIEYACRGVY